MIKYSLCEYGENAPNMELDDNGDYVHIDDARPYIDMVNKLAAIDRYNGSLGENLIKLDGLIETAQMLVKGE